MNSDENPYEVSEEYLAFIGSATFAWSYLDIGLQIFIWALLEIPVDDNKHGLQFTNDMFFSARVNLATTLLSLRREQNKLTEHQFKRMLNDVSDAKSLSEKRNRLMHGYFDVAEGGVPFIRHANTRRRGNPKHSIHFDDLDKYREFINACVCLESNFSVSVSEIDARQET